jgi:phenylpyruvate tautomerase PptA (4-oxalocrotonate tautomerase family)
MPILEVEIVSAKTSKNPPAGLAQTLADAAADVLGSPPGGTWVRIQLIPAERYAEKAASPMGCTRSS